MVEKSLMIGGIRPERIGQPPSGTDPVPEPPPALRSFMAARLSHVGPCRRRRSAADRYLSDGILVTTVIQIRISPQYRLAAKHAHHPIGTHDSLRLGLEAEDHRQGLGERF